MNDFESIVRHFKKLNSSINDIKNKVRRDTFELVFMIAGLIGLPLNPELLKSDDQPLDTFTQVYCIIATAFKTLMYIVYMLYIFRIVPNASSQCTIALFGTFGYLCLWTVIKQRKNLTTSIIKLKRMLKDLSHHHSVPESSSEMALAKILFLLQIVVIAVTIKLFVYFYDQWGKSLQEMEDDKRGIDDYLHGYIAYAHLALIVTYIVSAVTRYVTFFLCCTTFQSLQNAMNLSADKMRDDFLLNRDCSSELIAKHMRLFKVIIASVKDIDENFGNVIFITYGTIFSNFFNVICIAFSDNQVYQTTAVKSYMVWCVLLEMLIFLTLTYSGDKIVQGGENLKQAVIECSGKIVTTTVPLDAKFSFYLMALNIKETNLTITGHGVFKIQKGFVLNVVGVIVSYGVLMYQMTGLMHKVPKP